MSFYGLIFLFFIILFAVASNMEDGRVALWVDGKGSLRVYDPMTGACTEVADMGRFSSVIGLSTAAIG